MKIAPPKWRVMLYCGIALFIACFFIFGEPFTNGHFLSTWLSYGVENSRGQYDDSMFAPDVEKVEPAIRRIGPKAIPVLLEKLDAGDPAWKACLNQWQKNADWWPDMLEFKFRWAEEDQREAIYGFGVLNTQAVSAIPALVQRLSTTNSSAMAAYCLTKIGLPALPELKMVLTNEKANVRFTTLYSLEWNPDLLKEMLPQIRLMTNDTYERTAAGAYSLLSRHGPTNETMAFQREALRDARTLVVRHALSRMGTLGTNARPYILEISNLLVSPDQSLRNSASNVLKRIDPAMAFAMGVNTNPPVRMIGRRGGPGGGRANPRSQ